MRPTQAVQARVRPPESKMFSDAITGRSIFSLVCIRWSRFSVRQIFWPSSVRVGILRQSRQGHWPLCFPDWLSLLPSFYRHLEVAAVLEGDWRKSGENNSTSEESLLTVCKWAVIPLKEKQRDSGRNSGNYSLKEGFKFFVLPCFFSRRE